MTTPITRRIAAIALALAAAGAVPAAHAKGCLKGAAIGGVAGHVVGRHGLVGAAAGCAIGHHREKVKDREASDAAAARNTPPREPRSGGRSS